MATPVNTDNQPRKRAFALLPNPVGIQQRPKIPRVNDLVVSEPVAEAKYFLPAPPFVKENLGSPSVIIGFDIETHDWKWP